MNDDFKKGRLKKWNEERGFGFIESGGREGDLFIHISALKKMSRKPVVGDIIHFQIHQQPDGKLRAVNGRIEGVKMVSPQSRNPGKPRPRGRNAHARGRSSRGGLAASVVMVGVVAALLVSRVFDSGNEVVSVPATALPSTSTPSVSRSNFQCEGKTHCSEMSSCQEARFYLANCPNTKMDGDGDGVPCESQWCNGW